MLEEIAMAGKMVEKGATVKVARQRLSVLDMQHHNELPTNVPISSQTCFLLLLSQPDVNDTYNFLPILV